ncbi:MAG: hypothetical protein CMH52_09705 [Myxococcales bacterium]|nr:hypothetical protein [Myxococcales bacterium]
MAQAGLAQTPIMDGPFPTLSLDDDSNLTLVRERYNPDKRIQSIYLRVADGTPDYDVTSGEIFIDGAEIIGIIVDRIELKTTDVEWAIDGVDYGRERGLDGPAPLVDYPIEDGEFDYAEMRQSSVRFWFGTGSDIDDMRILIRYPEENASAKLRPTLYHSRGRDPHPDTGDFPGSDDRGIQVGSIIDVAPDDGLYDEAFSIESGVKLKVEDFDILEAEIDIGIINYVGGAVGPGTVTIENGFRDLDPDGDNGVDLRGDIDPIPTTGMVAHLRYEVQPLRGPEGSQIPTSGIQVLGLPRQLIHGERRFGRVSVDTPADLPEGLYEGLLTIWEDNNVNGSIDPGEPSDSVNLVVVVQDRVDAAVDASIVDAGLPDQAVDMNRPDPDMAIEDDSDIDMAASDLGLDAATDMARLDQTVDSALTDAAIDISFIDGHITDSQLDANSSTDTGSIDALSQDAAARDAGDHAGRDDIEQWPSLPQGGGLNCQALPFSPGSLLVMLFLLPILRRRG